MTVKEVKKYHIIDITMPTDVENEFDPYRESGLSMENVLLVNIGKTHDPYYFEYHHLFLVMEYKKPKEV